MIILPKPFNPRELVAEYELYCDELNPPSQEMLLAKLYRGRRYRNG